MHTVQSAPSWEKARALFEMARADMAVCGDSNEEIDLYGLAHCAAEQALLKCAALDAEALAFKLEVFRDEEAYRLADDFVRAVLDQMVEDVRRLVGRP